jgi:predicted PurR-regulated permease PerM
MEGSMDSGTDGPADFGPPNTEATTRANVLILPTNAERGPQESDESLGVLGRPFDHRAPFFVGLSAAFGVAVAYVIVRGIADITSVLVIIGLSLFIAIGLDPIVAFLVSRGLRRGVAVGMVTLGFLLVIGAFILAAVSPLSHEIQTLVRDYPRYKANVAAGKGWAGRLATKLHLTSDLKRKMKLKIPIDGVLGAGKMLLSVGVATVSVIALTIYFLIALPGVKSLWLSLIPRSRRVRAALITDEVCGRVGGFMLGNLLTSLISGVGTYVWLVIFGIPYAVLLALLVALLDLIPLVGSTIGGIIVSLVALSKGLPVAIATAGFYVIYRFLEDYLLNPRVMKHTVKVTPGLTIIATLIGGTLLGLIGALVAIPVAATIYLLLEEVAIPRQNQK